MSISTTLDNLDLEKEQSEIEKTAGKTIQGSSLQNHSTDNFADSIIENQIKELEENKADEYDFDLLSVYFGEDYWVNDYYVICQPTVQDFLNCKEKNIYATIAPFTSNPTSYRVQLWDMGVDWNKIEDFELFAMLVKTLNIEYSSIIFKRIMTQLEFEKYVINWKLKNNPTQEQLDEFIGNIDIKSKDLLVPLDFSLFGLYRKNLNSDNNDNNNSEEFPELILYDQINNLEISNSDYLKMANYIRFMFNSYPEVEHCKGKTLKKQLINNDKLKQARLAQEQKGSNMMSLISFALNHPGFKYKKNELRDIGIVEFMNSIQRLQIYESTHALMGGMYSGFVDTKKIDSKEFDFMRDISHK